MTNAIRRHNPTHLPLFGFVKAIIAIIWDDTGNIAHVHFDEEGSAPMMLTMQANTLASWGKRIDYALSHRPKPTQDQ